MGARVDPVPGDFWSILGRLEAAMSREGALTGGRAAGVPAGTPPGADSAAVAGVCLALGESWAVGALSGVDVAAEVDACLLLAALSNGGSSSSPAMVLPATCTAHACLSSTSRPAEPLPGNSILAKQVVYVSTSGHAEVYASSLQDGGKVPCRRR